MIQQQIFLQTTEIVIHFLYLRPPSIVPLCSLQGEDQ